MRFREFEINVIESHILEIIILSLLNKDPELRVILLIDVKASENSRRREENRDERSI